MEKIIKELLHAEPEFNEFRNEIYSLKKRTLQKLSEKGFCKTFREIKDIDTIVIDDIGAFEDYLVESEVRPSTMPYEMQLPFLTEGVIRSRNVKTKILHYYHFKVLECDLDNRTATIDVTLYIYTYSFFPVFKCEYKLYEDVNGKMNVSTNGCYHYADFYEDMDEREMSEKERRYLQTLKMQYAYLNEEKALSDHILNHIELFMVHIVGLNHILEKQREARLAQEKERQTIILPKSEKTNSGSKPVSKKDKRAKIVIDGNISVVPGVKTNFKIRKGFVINRHTDVWGVAGHIRHYRDGKIVYIKPYKKGPGREKSNPDAKTYQVKL